MGDVQEHVQHLKQALRELEQEESKGARMKATELDGDNDPTRKIPVVVGGLPDGAKVWVQADPLKHMHHVTVESPQGNTYTTSVTDMVLASTKDVADIQKAIVDDLLMQMNEQEDTSKYRDIKLSYWKWLVEETVNKHVSETGAQPNVVHLSQEVYDYIVQAEDDLPRASTRSLGHKKVAHIIPADMEWRTRQPSEGDFKRFIRVR